MPHLGTSSGCPTGSVARANWRAGGYLVVLIQPWGHYGCDVAADSTALRAKGGVWHDQNRQPGPVRHTAIDLDLNVRLNACRKTA
jgi:hypothetical protein